MIVNVEVGELHVRAEGERVNLIVYAEQGNVCLSLSPLAAHNLGVALPDYVQEAAGATIGNCVNEMGGHDVCGECGGPLVAGEGDGNTCGSCAGAVVSQDDVMERYREWELAGSKPHRFQLAGEVYCRGCGSSRTAIHHIA